MNRNIRPNKGVGKQVNSAVPSKRVYSLTLLLLSCFMPNIAYADIDLSSLSDGSVESHSHIYKDFYDETNHWKQCDICKEIDSLGNHTLTSKWTISSTSCSPNNYKITSCSECEYEAQELNKNKHTLNRIGHGITEDGKGYVVSSCSSCKNNYARSSEGHTYTYSNGTVVDMEKLTIGSKIYNEYGQSYTINSMYKEYNHNVDYKELDWSLSEDNKTLSITARIDMPDLAHQWFSTSQFTNTNYVYQYLYLDGLSTSGDGVVNYSPKSVSYDASTDILTSTYKVSIRDYNKKYMKPGYFTISLYLANGNWYAGYNSKPIIINTNFIDPTIGSTDIE